MGIGVGARRVRQRRLDDQCVAELALSVMQRSHSLHRGNYEQVKCQEAAYRHRLELAVTATYRFRFQHVVSDLYFKKCLSKGNKSKVKTRSQTSARQRKNPFRSFFNYIKNNSYQRTPSKG